MPTERRFVVDTNVLISAALFAVGKPNQVVFEILRTGELLGSAATLEELETRLRRRKFEKYLLSEKREAYLTLIRERSRLVPITEAISACRDPRDNKFLELAVSGRADAIITGDDDLLVLHPYRGIPILTPAAFLSSSFKQ